MKYIGLYITQILLFNNLPNKGQMLAFFHECSVVTSKLDITQILLFNNLPNKGQMLAFFHECSVVTSKLDPNYNLVYKLKCLFILLLSILLHFQFARPRVLFIFITFRMIETFL